jgi:hypothetical protein
MQTRHDNTTDFLIYTTSLESSDSAVGTVTDYGQDDRWIGVSVPVRQRIFTSRYRQERLWSPPNLLSNGYRRHFHSGVKLQGLEADHSPPTSAEAKKTWIYTSTVSYVFMDQLCTGTILPFLPSLAWRI